MLHVVDDGTTTFRDESCKRTVTHVVCAVYVQVKGQQEISG